MKAIFINHCHPEINHVCGVRAGRFAEIMAVRGHKIMLLTETLADKNDSFLPRELEHRLAAHNWRRPFQLSCLPSGDFDAIQARHGALPAGRQQLAVLWSFIKHGGMFPDWQTGVVPYISGLAKVFRPDVVWGTFGNTDTWRLCQQLAGQANCPWIGDLKDNWLAFIPRGLQTLLAGRFKDTAGMTVFSSTHYDQADAVFPNIMKTVLYSGVDMETSATGPADGFQLMLTGSIYDQEALVSLTRAVDEWSHARPEKNVIFRYAGNDGEIFKACAEGTSFSSRIEGFLGHAELHHLQSAAAANLYIYNPRCLLHYKALELIAQGRPVIAFPGETPEVKSLASNAGAVFFTCDGKEPVMQALDMIADTPTPPLRPDRLRDFTWERRTKVLESVLEHAVSRARQQS